MKRDRDSMYSVMRDLAQHQVKAYGLIQRQDDRQQRQLSNQQQQIFKLTKSLNQKIDDQ